MFVKDPMTVCLIYQENSERRMLLGAFLLGSLRRLVRRFKSYTFNMSLFKETLTIIKGNKTSFNFFLPKAQKLRRAS